MVEQVSNSAKRDEFGDASVHALPQPNREGASPWRGIGPTYHGELTPCFEGGHLFRVLNEEEKTWALYNDTSVFEMHVTFTFGKDSEIEPLGDTQITVNEKGEFIAFAVVYPMETVMFIHGHWDGYKSHCEGKPLSQEYLQRIARPAAEVVAKAMEATKQICASHEEEVVLQACLARRDVPFVDPIFPPVYSSIDNHKQTLPEVPWGRPEEYLSKDYLEHVRLFRVPITSSSAERGDLSDSWLISAIAMLAERPECVKNMFRHPLDPTLTVKEAAVGAYRVLINKDGLWKSYLVDSYLPTVGGKPRFARTKGDPCELWVSLLEKAYAKRNGSYVSICSGDSLFAVRDLTGLPTSRLDVAFNEAKAESTKSDEFFARLVTLCQQGHTILFSAPGNGDERTKLNKCKEAGIAIGYALGVLDVRHINGHGLFRLRNPWSNGVEWKGNWSPSSHLWTDNPEMAAIFPNHDGTDGSLWMDWADIKNYFIGCGVVFNQPSPYDYRVSGNFVKTLPSVCMVISVTEPTTLTFILSQPDHRGTSKDATDYDPIMINLASSEDGGVSFTVVANTSADAAAPTERYVFLYGRDVNMIVELTPEHSPYMLVPRRMDSGESMEEVLPFALGVLSSVPITKDGPVKILFKKLQEKNEVFENYPEFADDGESISVEYQVKHPNSILETRTANQLFE